MAQRKGGVVAPAKQKLRKNHGPKRKMFHDYDSTMRLHFASAGVLDKYHNFESFAQYCAAKGVKKYVKELWDDFRFSTVCRSTSGEWVASRELQDKYFQEIAERGAMLEQSLNKGKKSLPKSKK